jgi:DNA-binding transcriptional MerR regulator
MLTSELAKRAAVPPDTVRYYTKRGLIAATKNPHNGYKEYDAAALQKLKFIHQAREIGFSLSQIEEIIEAANDGQSPCPTVRQMLQQQIEQTKRQIQQMNAHLHMLESTNQQWDQEPDSTPNGASICCLIESWAQTHSEEQS